MGLRSERGPVLLAVMLATGLIAIDSTILATAVPSVVDDLGGFAEFPWLFSVYLLAQAVSVPVYGKLADLFGRKPVILFGIALFLAASVLCGLAWDMGTLIGARALQGLGAGAIAPMTITIVGDLYTTEERAKAQGYVASVWGIAAVVGPAAGGFLSEYASWRWIFLVNVPLCLLAAAMIVRNYPERVERSRPVVDHRGAVLLTAGLTGVILAVLEGGQQWAWTSPLGIALLAGGTALLAAFVVLERSAPEPVLPLWVFRDRLLVAAGIISAAVGAILIGLTSYIPTYVQDVLGYGPVVAGFALATLTMGWPLAASQSGKVYLRIGFRGCALIGTVIVLAGTLLLLALGRGTSVWYIAVACLVIGVGMGLTVSPTIVAAQGSVGWRERGVVTANNLFLRSVGSAVGIAVFGALVNAVVGAGEPDPAALTTAVLRVVFGLVGLAVLMVVFAALVPGGRSVTGRTTAG